jgi:hypothetical protein
MHLRQTSGRREMNIPMKYQILKAKRWTKTHVQYPCAANVVTFCRYGNKPDTVEELNGEMPTCLKCLQMLCLHLYLELRRQQDENSKTL